MTENSSDVVIVGGGIAGLTTSYYLAKARVPSVVVERDAIGSHASGFAYGGLSPLSGFGIPGPWPRSPRTGCGCIANCARASSRRPGLTSTSARARSGSGGGHVPMAARRRTH
jgi:2-polyprenyl-6-methoxyphenol hydroxylase-like FAD-dependent oxidoreductase